MTACEKCWRDSGSNTVRYHALLDQRQDNPCSPIEQAGQWWDYDNQRDSRFLRGEPLTFPAQTFV